MLPRTRAWSLLICSLLFVVAGPRAEQANDPGADPAIGGYSPVSYFTVDAAERGSPEHASIHDGETYYFTSADQVTRFEQSPERFVPAYGAYCPYNLALGRRERIDPTNFKVVDGQLLLFHRSAEMDGRQEFEAHDRQQELLERANREFVLMQF